MCSYGGKYTYKQHYACFDCRKMFRTRNLAQATPGHVTICPQCRKPMTDMGLAFKAPRHSDRQSWKLVEIMAQYRVTFHHRCCSGPGYRPSRLQDLPDFLSRVTPRQMLPKRPQRWRYRAGTAKFR